jgi:hypothetical protein
MKKYNKFRKLPVVKKKICNAKPRHLKLPENFNSYVGNMSQLCRVVFIVIFSINGVLAFSIFKGNLIKYYYTSIAYAIFGVILPIILVYWAYCIYLKYINMIIESYNNNVFYNFDYEYILKVKNFFVFHVASIGISLIVFLIFIFDLFLNIDLVTCLYIFIFNAIQGMWKIL